MQQIKSELNVNYLAHVCTTDAYQYKLYEFEYSMRKWSNEKVFWCRRNGVNYN